MDAALNSVENGFPLLILYLLVVTFIYIVGVVIYVKLTPHKELELIQNGNMAAAVTFSALVLSLAMPLAACMVNKIGLIDVAVWGTISLFMQLFLFRFTDFFFKDMPNRIHNDEVPAALVLASFKIAGSLVLAMAIVG